MTEPTHAFARLCRHGGALELEVDLGQEIAGVAAVLRDGGSVRRVTLAEARAIELYTCAECAPRGGG